MNHFVPENWKPVPSKPGVMASDLGRVLLPPSYAPMHQGGYRLYEPAPKAYHRSRTGENNPRVKAALKRGAG